MEDLSVTTWELQGDGEGVPLKPSTTSSTDHPWMSFFKRGICMAKSFRAAVRAGLKYMIVKRNNIFVCITYLM